MRSLKIPLLITLIVSLGFGMGLGFKLRRDRATQLGVVTGSHQLKVLALTGTFPPDVVRAFGAKENIRIELNEEPTPDAVFARLQSSTDLDLVTLLTTQISKATQAAKIQPFLTSQLKGFGAVSRDFVDLPGHSLSVVPILWGVARATVSDGDSDSDDENPVKINLRKTSLKDLAMTSNMAFKSGGADETGKGNLWILNLALAGSAKNLDEAHRFVSFILSAEAARAISSATHQRSTNTELNPGAIALDAELKPSALRTIRLTDLNLVFDEPVEAPKASPRTTAKPKNASD